MLREFYCALGSQEDLLQDFSQIGSGLPLRKHETMQVIIKTFNSIIVQKFSKLCPHLHPYFTEQDFVSRSMELVDSHRGQNNHN